MVHMGAAIAAAITSIPCLAAGTSPPEAAGAPARDDVEAPHDASEDDPPDPIEPGCCGAPSSTLAWLAAELSTDASQREYISAGAAAGLAAAFGAPVGGVLFSLEEASTFWSRKVTWRCFMAAAMASFVLAQVHHKGQAGLISFEGIPPPRARDTLAQLAFYTGTAACAGLAGTTFNVLTGLLSRLRPAKRSNAKRIAEACLVLLLTTVGQLLLAAHVGQCVTQPAKWSEESYGVQFGCPHGTVNDLASLFLSAPEETVGMLMSIAGSHEPNTNVGFHRPASLAIFAAAYLVMMSLACGIAVPGGLFMPAIMLGAATGALSGLGLQAWLGDAWHIQPGTYALIGATATLGGVFRSSISLVVIVCEGTGAILYIFGIIVAVLVSNMVGSWVHHHGVYEQELERNGGVVFLQDQPSKGLEVLCASDLMSPMPVAFGPSESARHVLAVLRGTRHNGFPVVSEAGTLEGLVLRSQLLVLLERRVFVARPLERGDGGASSLQLRELAGLDALMRSFHRRVNPHRRYRSALPETLRRAASEAFGLGGGAEEVLNGAESAEEAQNAADLNLDLRPFMHRAPLSVRPEYNAARVHSLFRALGLRHLCVTDSSNALVGIVTRKDLTNLE